jgi:hypothetical protein
MEFRHHKILAVKVNKLINAIGVILLLGRKNMPDKKDKKKKRQENKKWSNL